MKNINCYLFLVISCSFLHATTFGHNLSRNKLSAPIKEKKTVSLHVPQLTVASVSCVQNGNWNDPNTWSTNAIPTAADDVVIGMGYIVTLSDAIQAQKISVMGVLRPQSSSTNFSIVTRGIMVMGGLFEVGTPTVPYTGLATITLTGTNTTENLFGTTSSMGTKLIASMDGGIIRMEGQEKKSWTNLNSDAAVGNNQITLKDAVGWKVGDEIVIVSSRSSWNEAEKRVISAVSNGNKTVSFSQPLNFPHVGTVLNYTRSTDNKIWNADIRAEVGLLSHNIKIQGDDASDINGFGGHIMIHAGGIGYFNNVELYRMGQKAKQGRYPIHWHMLASAGAGQYIKNSSIHSSYNRAVTIHGTHSITVENNFAYDHIGHGVFLENGSEINNIIRANVVVLSKRPVQGEELTPSDNQFDQAQNRTPSSYWITNPNNIFINNVAAGTEGTGFWYALANNFMFDSATDSRFVGQTLPYREVFGGFTGNKAHSCMNGIDLFDRLDANHSILPNGSWDEPNPKVFANNTWYSNEIGIYTGIGGGRLLSSLITFRNDVFVENLTNSMLASYSTIDQSLFVANSGYNLRAGERFIHRLYDGAGSVTNTHIVGYNANNANFLSNFGADIRHPNHNFENITFDPPVPIRAVSEDYYNTSIVPVLWLTAVKDKTGSFTGNPNSTIVTNHQMFLVGDEVVPHNWVNLYATHRKYLHASIFYDGTTSLPFLSLTRSKSGTKSSMFYESYNFLNKHQMTLITNDGFLYTYQYESLPSNKQIRMVVSDAEIGDSYLARFKDFGKLGGLIVTSLQATFTNYSSLTDLNNSSTAGFFAEPNGDLYIKTFANVDLRTYTIRWTNNFVVPPLDTDGDGYQDKDEQPIAGSKEIKRNPATAADLSFDFKATTDGWVAQGSIGSSCEGCNNRWEINSNGTNPQIIRTGLNFDANNVPNIYVNIKSFTSGNFKLYWTSTEEPNYSEDKSILLPYSASNQTELLNFAVQGNLKWNNKIITKLRLDLVASTGNTYVYSIFASAINDTDGDGYSDVEEFNQCRNRMDVSDFGINFDQQNDSQNAFNSSSILNFNISNGVISGKATNADPIFEYKNARFKINGSLVPKLKLRIKVSAPTTVEFFWRIEGNNSNPNGVRRVAITQANTWQEIVFDMTGDLNWDTKTITWFRIDPAIHKDVSFEIDWIRSLNYTDCSITPCTNTYTAGPLLTENSWTYYGIPGAAGENNYLFAIQHNPIGGNTVPFVANINLTKLCNNNVYQVTNTASKDGIFIGGYYWNINVTNGILNGLVNIRFFFDELVNMNLNTVSNTFYVESGANYYSPSVYFKTDNILNLPADIRPDAKGLNYGFLPLKNSSTGNVLGKNYIQFDNVNNINNSGGGLIRQVTNINENYFKTSPAQLKGAIRYNSSIHKFEGFNGSIWSPLH